MEMDLNKKIYGQTILCFAAALAACSITIGGIILFESHPGKAWYTYPENIALVIAGLLITALVSLLVQKNTAMKKMIVYFENMAITDTLTCVYNRRYVDENIDRLIQSLSGSNVAITMIMIIIDFFKEYNDIHGYKKGDECLKIIANILSQIFRRDTDFVARYGGREFIIILPETGEEAAHVLTEKLLKTIHDCNIQHENSSASDRLTISAGVITGSGSYSQYGIDYIKKAKEALHESEQKGHNRYTLVNL